MPLSTKAGRTIKVKMDRVLCEIEDVYSDETRAMFIGIRRVLFFYPLQRTDIFTSN